MSSDLDISKYLDAVLQDWKNSQGDFPSNVYLLNYWPVPFFGNPRTAVVATVGVNPSSGEFKPARNWDTDKTSGDWKRRLKHYFRNRTPPHRWFVPWSAGLKVLGASYERGTAAHLDISYRPTKAMLRNQETDPREFRRMVERDVAWFFRLLPLCERLRLLLVFGPIVRTSGTTESLVTFLRRQAARCGFSVLRDGGLRVVTAGGQERVVCIHEVRTSGRASLAQEIVQNIRAHQPKLIADMKT